MYLLTSTLYEPLYITSMNSKSNTSIYCHVPYVSNRDVKNQSLSFCAALFVYVSCPNCFNLLYQSPVHITKVITDKDFSSFKFLHRARKMLTLYQY